MSRFEEYLEDEAVLFSCLEIFYPSHNKVGNYLVFFGAEGNEYIFVKYYSCLLYTSDAADE